MFIVVVMFCPTAFGIMTCLHGTVSFTLLHMCKLNSWDTQVIMKFTEQNEQILTHSNTQKVENNTCFNGTTQNVQLF